MPKGVVSKYYAVLNGRDGPKIYTTLDDYRTATAYFSAASGKSFLTYEEARQWLDISTTSSSAALGCKNYATVSNATEPLPTTEVTTQQKYVNVSVQCDDASVATPTTPMPIAHRINKHDQLLTPPATPPVVLPSAATPTSERIQLSTEQLRVLHMVKSGRNVFFTGPAGTGKSVLLRAIICQFREDHNFVDSIAVTAPTGIAGLNIGGSTIHAWGGIGLGKEPADVLADRIEFSPRLSSRWRGVKVLVIDEISMLDGTLFDKLEYIARTVRKSSEPFGGIQLVLCGDFFQLPPVPDQSHRHKMPATFTFNAITWSKCISRPIFLSQVFRQKDDVFISILSSMRQGIITLKHVQQLQQLARPLIFSDGIEPTQLFPLRRDVDTCNNNHLNALNGPEHTYIAMDAAGWDVYNEPIPIESVKNLLARLIAPSNITLKLGAQVMLLLNVEQGVLVNGSVGKVIDFLTHHQALERQIRIVDLKESRRNIPVHLKVKTREKDSTILPDVSVNLRPTNDHVFEKNLSWPLVRFSNGVELLCSPMAFSVQGFKGNIEAHRLQVPLIPAWAISIHKSQGQTLTRVKVDLGHTFEKGQAYVALSRATSMEGLEITNFQPSKVLAHPDVVEWHSSWTLPERSVEEEMDSEEAISRFWQ